MRAAPTHAEALLWAALRNRRLGGWKFRRQHVVAGYIVDFYCAELWLAVEVDGAVHEDHRDRDERRDADLAAIGMSVVRLDDNDVIDRLRTVLDRLELHCRELALLRSPPPSPAR